VDKLAEIARRRKHAHARLRALKSSVYEAFLRMEAAAFADGALSKKTKELIALGISVTIDCESCMQWHLERAAAAGATMREALEAIEVGIEMGGGPATVSARFALEVLDRIHSKPRATARDAAQKGRSRRRPGAPPGGT
jgi:AhpD family alkylhydroperoxidase